MKTNRCWVRGCWLGVMLALAVLMAGCATQPCSMAKAAYTMAEVEGTWSWHQDPWHGTFVLKRDGNSCSGTLDDTYEGTRGDKIGDVAITGDAIKLTRYGQWGVQQWTGTLKRDNGVLKIVDGKYTKWGAPAGTFTAEKEK
jgi:hypothetical protein